MSRRLGAVLALACVLRVAWAVAIPVRPVSDSAAYDAFARVLAGGGGYGWTAGEPSAYWPVGTSAIYAALYALFGTSTLPVVILNVILGAAIVLLTGRLARRWFGERAGLIAAGVVALWPSLVAFTTVLASELPFLFLLLLGVDRMTGSFRRHLLAGLCFGAAALIRPQALLVPAVLAAGEMLRGTSWRAALPRLALAGAAMFAVVLPWSLRNQRELGAFVLVSTNGGANFWMGNNPATTGGYMPLPPWTEPLDEVSRDRALGREAAAYVRAHPLAFAGRTLKKLARLHDRETIGAAWNPGLRERFGPLAERAFKAGATLYWWAALGFGLAALALLFRRDGLLAGGGHPAFALWACMAFAHAVIVVQDRYHFPAIPLVAALAAWAVAELFRAPRKDVAPPADPPARADAPTRTLAVDLDGTLVKTDTLWESVCAMAGRRPTALLALPFWLIGGRARLKERAAQEGAPDVGRFPYREEVLTLVRERRAAGGRVVLATAADRSTADRVGKHLGLFDEVIASDGVRNLKGAEKAEALRKATGGPFDYVGDSDADLPLIGAAERVWLVEPSERLRQAAESSGKLEKVLAERRSRLKPLLRLLRPHQWAKNALVFVPLIAGHRLFDVAALTSCALAAACFCLAASGVYVLNDLFDLESDRGHPRKRRRPLASGELPIPWAWALAPLLLAGAGVLAVATLSWSFLGWLGGYVALTTLYSAWLKRKVFVDALLLAGLYSYRIFAGGEAAGIALSDWLIVFSMFLFLSLALAKRYCEVDQTSDGESNKRRGYRAEDVALLRTLGPCAGWMSVLVLALYVSSDATAPYPSRRLLWLVCPLLLYWITRYWFLAQRRETHDDPVVFALKDGWSLLAGAAAALVVAAASVG